MFLVQRGINQYGIERHYLYGKPDEKVETLILIQNGISQEIREAIVWNASFGKEMTKGCPQMPFLLAMVLMRYEKAAWGFTPRTHETLWRQIASPHSKTMLLNWFWMKSIPIAKREFESLIASPIWAKRKEAWPQTNSVIGSYLLSKVDYLLAADWACKLQNVPDPIVTANVLPPPFGTVPELLLQAQSNRWDRGLIDITFEPTEEERVKLAELRKRLGMQ